LLLAPMMAIDYAHLVMLAQAGHRAARDAHRIRVALDSVSQDEVKRAKYDGTFEDLFFYVEQLVIDACGEEAAGRLHTARSRNDIDMTMYRMRQREFILGLMAGSFELRVRSSTSSMRIATRSSRSTRTRSAPSPRAWRTTCSRWWSRWNGMRRG
jgi:argininosuccinate lyase